jgi:SP family arabinose:H+ symporter-like MFS transporter
MKRNNVKALIVSLTVASGILCGYILGVIALVFPILAAKHSFAKEQISLIAGSILLGCFVASIYTGSLADWLGRRKVIALTAAIYIVGIIGFILSSNYWWLYFYRTIQGVAYGMCEIVVPLYLVEISATQWRGQIITAFKVANTAGALVSSLVWLIIPTSMFQMPFYIALTLSIFICLLILVLPESPRWLIFNNKIAAAKAILARVYKDENQAQVLVNEICASANSIKTNVWKELFSKSSIFPFLAVLAVVSLSQLTGIIVFIQNSIQILKDCGINSPIIGIYGMIAINGINFVALLLTMLLIEKIGRRLILMIGTIGVFVSLVTLAMLHYFLLPGLLLGYITLCGIVLVVGFFAFGPSGIVLVISTELLPNRVRGLAISIAFTFGALVGTIFVSWFGKLSSQIGYANLFLIMSGFALCYFITAYLIPETKGKDLEKISWQDKKA